MNYLIFGGSGFIGTHLIHRLKDACVKPGDCIYDLDLVMPGEEGVVPGIVEKNEGVVYRRVDVRKPIALDFTPTPDDVIFNLAAVHRTPGHPDYAYFETNIRGAENVTAFAEQHGIRKILFTSSIAPYGAAEELKTEDTLPTPNTPYGISKLVAEKIHQIWQAREANRELTIVRPGIVYGKGEHGNMTRLYNSQKKHYFFYAGRKDTVKACIYVKELVRFFQLHVRAGVHHRADLQRHAGGDRDEAPYSADSGRTADDRGDDSWPHRRQESRHSPGACEETDGEHEHQRPKAGGERLCVPRGAGGHLPRLVCGLRQTRLVLSIRRDEEENDESCHSCRRLRHTNFRGIRIQAQAHD